MQYSVSAHDLKENRLLSILPAAERYDFRSHFERVPLAKGDTLDGRNQSGADEYAYFPVDSVVSLVSTMENEQMELAMVGRDGATGVYNSLGFNSLQYKSVVRIPGEAFRIKSAILRAKFEQNTVLSILLMQYLHALYSQIAQVAICYRRHKIQQRLQTWLKMAFNRVAPNDELILKQDEIAGLLGYRRPTVSYVTSALQEQEIIRYSRGRIRLLDAERLEAGACECYGIMESQYERIAPPEPQTSMSPALITEANLTDRTQEFIQQLGSAIQRVRHLCDLNETIQKRQMEVITGRASE